jgi:hypothetical protein
MATQGLLLPIRFVDEHPAVSDAQRLEGSRFAGRQIYQLAAGGSRD